MDEEIYITPMEANVLIEFSKGKDRKQVAKALNIKLPTLSSHLLHIYDKLCLSGSDKLTRAVIWYLKDSEE